MTHLLWPWRESSLYLFISLKLSPVHSLFFPLQWDDGKFPAILPVTCLSLSNFCKGQAKFWPRGFPCEGKEGSEMTEQGRNRQDYDFMCRTTSALAETVGLFSACSSWLLMLQEACHHTGRIPVKCCVTLSLEHTINKCSPTKFAHGGQGERETPCILPKSTSES